MKKAFAAVILVAFMGAVAFASLESRDSTKNTKQDSQKKEQKDIRKKKECKRTCIFS